MIDIVGFLTARLDEDQAAAHAAAAFYDDADENGVSWSGHEGENQNGFMNFWLVPHLGVIYDPASGQHIVRHDPARVLAEVAAKRRVLARHCPADPRPMWSSPAWRNVCACIGCGLERDGDWNTEDINDCPELRDLAAVYADHPDFDPAWTVD